MKEIMSNNVRVEDRLEGASNFFSWKTRITTILEELKIETYIEEDIPIPQMNMKNSSGKDEIIKQGKSLLIQ